MPRNSSTGEFVRVSNSFSDPVTGTIIDAPDANELNDDYDLGLTNAIPIEPRIVTASGTITVAADDGPIFVNKTIPAATTINLPTALARNGTPLIISDYAGNANTYPITIVPSGSETIGGATTLTLNTSRGVVTLYPSTTINSGLGGWYLSNANLSSAQFLTKEMFGPGSLTSTVTAFSTLVTTAAAGQRLLLAPADYAVYVCTAGGTVQNIRDGLTAVAAWIPAAGATIEVRIPSGVYSESGATNQTGGIFINHPYGSQLKVQAPPSTNLVFTPSATGLVSITPVATAYNPVNNYNPGDMVTNGGFAWTCRVATTGAFASTDWFNGAYQLVRLQLNSTTGMAAGRFLIVGAITGTNDYRNFRGYHQIDTVHSATEVSIRVYSPNTNLDPSGATTVTGGTFSVKMLPVEIHYTNFGAFTVGARDDFFGLAIGGDQGGVGNGCSIDRIGIIGAVETNAGAGSPWAGKAHGIMVDYNTTVYISGGTGGGVAVANWTRTGFVLLAESQIYGSGVAASWCQANSYAALDGASAEFDSAYASSSSGGFVATNSGILTVTGCTATGCQFGYYAPEGGYINTGTTSSAWSCYSNGYYAVKNGFIMADSNTFGRCGFGALAEDGGRIFLGLLYTPVVNATDTSPTINIMGPDGSYVYNGATTTFNTQNLRVGANAQAAQINDIIKLTKANDFGAINPTAFGTPTTITASGGLTVGGPLMLGYTGTVNALAFQANVTATNAVEIVAYNPTSVTASSGGSRTFTAVILNTA